MKPIRSAACVFSAGALAVLLTGCSMIDTLIWGSDGARVIQMTEKLADDVASGRAPDILCADSVAELGDPGDWSGLSAGEPEEFLAGHWAGQAALDPQWSINLEGLPPGAVPGDRYPGDVFYRETGDGLCVTDISWGTLESAG